MSGPWWAFVALAILIVLVVLIWRGVAREQEKEANERGWYY